MRFSAAPVFRVAAAAGFSLFFAAISIGAESPAHDARYATSVEAEFRGCESAGWCRFWIEPPNSFAESLLRVRPGGVVHAPGSEAVSIALRDHLNRLLSNMIQQAKHLVLHDLRDLGDGTFAATVTVNGIALASDPMLLELCARFRRPDAMHLESAD